MVVSSDIKEVNPLISPRAVRQIELRTIAEHVDWGQLVLLVERKKRRLGWPRVYSRLWGSPGVKLLALVGRLREKTICAPRYERRSG